MDAYEIFSRFYDQYIKDTFPLLHQKYFDLALEIIDKFNPDATSILDASCGTGILAKKFLDSGYNIEGSDISKDMLTYANQKGLKTYNKNICDLALSSQYDVILCFDSLGHVLGNKNLGKALSSISACLKDNGIFICDGGTRNKAKHMVGQTFTYDSEAYGFTWLNEKHENAVNVRMKIHEKRSGRNFEEIFSLEGHDIEDMVAAAGATDLNICYATLEPIVKPNGSFVACFKKS